MPALESKADLERTSGYGDTIRTLASRHSRLPVSLRRKEQAGPQTTNLGRGSSNLFGRAIFIRCRRSSAAQARTRRPRQPAEAATPSNYFLCRDPGAGFAPSCLGECAIAARHEPEHRTMWYRKNVGGWERAARLIGGGLMLICGVVALHASPLGLLLSGAGVVTLVTGVFGYCPACAIAGREPLKG